MTPAPHRRAVLFDLDGTLVDSALDLSASVNRVLATLSRPMLQLPEVKAMVGDGARALLERALRATGGPPDAALLDLALGRFREDYERNAVIETRAYPGAIEALDLLAAAGWHLGICTNKPQRPSLIVLERLNLLGRFATVIGGDSTPHRKPHPAPLLAALAALEVAPSDAVLVGDGMHDLEAARDAGAAFVGVAWGYGLAGLQAAGVQPLLERFEDLAQRLLVQTRKT